MDQEIRLQISNWLSSIGIDSQPSDGISTSIMLLACVLVAAIAVSALIPGEEPERSLQKIVDPIARLSKK